MSSGRDRTNTSSKLASLFKEADENIERSLFGSETDDTAELDISVSKASTVGKVEEEKVESSPVVEELKEESPEFESDDEAELDIEVEEEDNDDDLEEASNLHATVYEDEAELEEEEKEEKEHKIEPSHSYASINLHDPITTIRPDADLDDFITFSPTSAVPLTLPRRRKVIIPASSNSAHAKAFPSHTPSAVSDLANDEIILPGEHVLEYKDQRGDVYFQSMYYLTNKNRRVHILDPHDPIKQKTDLIYHMSPVIPYYKLSELAAMKTPQPGTLYLDASNDGLHYCVIDSENKLHGGTVDWAQLPKNFPHQTSQLLGRKESYLIVQSIVEHLGEKFAYDYKRIGDKVAGINRGGAQTGVYEFFYTYRGQRDKNGNQHVHRQELLLKQDNGYKDVLRRTLNKGLAQITQSSPLGTRQILHSKVIGEFVASRIMNALVGDSSSSIFYALVAPAKKPDRSGKHVYIGSIFYDQTDDLFRDIARVQNRKIPGVEPGVKNKRHRNVGTFNSDIYAAGLFETRPKDNAIIHFDKAGVCTYVRKPQAHAIWNPITQSIPYDYFDASDNPISKEAALQLGGQPRLRYHDVERIKIASLIVGDFDTHAENEMNTARREASSAHNTTGVFDPKALEHDKTLLTTDPEHKIGRLNRIDQAAALHDLTDEIHPHSYQNHWPLIQVSNHFRELPREIRVNRKMAEEADRQANFPQSVLHETIISALLETAEFYGASPIMEFMKRMGMHHIEKILVDKHKDGKALYQHLLDGNLSERDDETVKTLLVQEAIEWLTQKMVSRKASLRKMAFDIKMSLCIVKKPDGTFGVDDSEYNLADVILEYPEYASKEKLRLRNAEHYSGRIFTHKFDNKAARATAIDAMENALLKTATKIMGEQAAKANISDYVMKHYAKPTPEEAAKLKLPTNVHRFVATRETLKSEGKHFYHKLKKSTPHLSSAAASTTVTLKPNEFALHFVETTTHGSQTACYVMNVTRDHRHQITAHTLPPEVDPTEVFTQALIENCDPEVLHSDRKYLETLRYLAKKLSITAGQIDLTAFKALKPTRYNAILMDLEALHFDKDNYNTILMTAYNAATLQIIGGKTIPSKSYLEYAQKQCQSLVLSCPEGVQPTVKIMARTIEDPLLIQSYALVCKAFNWTFINLSNYSKTNPQVSLLVSDSAVVTAVESQLTPVPVNPAPVASRRP